MLLWAMKTLDKISWRALLIIAVLGCALFAVLPTASSKTNDDPLANKRVNAAEKVYRAVVQEHTSGLLTLDDVYVWSSRWLDSELAIAKTKTAKHNAFSSHYERMKALQKTVQAQVDTGMARVTSRLAADYFVSEAQDWRANKKIH